MNSCFVSTEKYMQIGTQIASAPSHLEAGLEAQQVLRASSRWVFLVMVVPDLAELLVNVQ